jgi:uncharacterized protein YbbC (DUF1343 family)
VSLFSIATRTVLAVMVAVSVSGRKAEGPVKTGAEVLLARPDAAPIGGLRIGLITNRSAVDSRGVPVVDGLARHPKIKLAALFAPEHGFYADRQGHIGDVADPASGVPVHSLYGKTYKPTPEMLTGLDALVFDIQDVGSRFYTFISTMYNSMEAAREAGVRFVVLDRPNPIGGDLIEGGVLETAYRSFTGPFEIPVRHGMTVGELARLFNAKVGAKLDVVPMSGWTRTTWFDQTGLPWAKPSPAMIGQTTATLYPGICFFEATNVECRVGDRPFERIAAPWLDAERAVAELARLKLPGVAITAEPVDTSAANPYSFRDASWWLGFKVEPAEDKGPGSAQMAGDRALHAGVVRRAIAFRITDRLAFRPVRTAVAALVAIRRLHGDQLRLEPKGFDRLSGTDRVRTKLVAGESADAIVSDWEASLPAFEKARQRYLLYR